MKYYKEKLSRETIDQKTGIITREYVERTSLELLGIGAIISSIYALLKPLLIG